MVFTKLAAFQCALFPCLHLRALWDKTGTELSSFFFFFFGGDVFGTARLAQLPRCGGNICSAWRKNNNLSLPRMANIMIYHVQSRSITFRTSHNHVLNKTFNGIGFDTGTSFACTWRVPKSNPIQNKYNQLNSFTSGTSSIWHCTLKSYPALVWHTRQLNLGYCHCSLLYVLISEFIFSALLYRWTRRRRQYRRCRCQI